MTPPAPAGNRGLTRMLYFDDSGSEQHGAIVYGWVEVAPHSWAKALRHWLELRKTLVRDYAVPVSTELHCTQYVNGRSRFSTAPPPAYISEDGDVQWKNLGYDVALRCLEALRDCEHITVGAYYSYEHAGGKVYGQERFATYARLLLSLDQELRDAGEHAIITMDGQDTHYRQAHRDVLKLDTRHIIEDPVMHDSRHSQWTQMADLVAYAANLELVGHKNPDLKDWYSTYLAARDPRGGPQAI